MRSHGLDGEGGGPSLQSGGVQRFVHTRVAGLHSLLVAASLPGWRGWSRKTCFPPGEIRMQVLSNAWVNTRPALKTPGPGAPPPPWCRQSGSQSSRTISPYFICGIIPVSKVLSV